MTAADTEQGGGAPHSLEDFVAATSQQDRGRDAFELESREMLEVNVDGLVWAKLGAMTAYRGQIKFTREGILAGGLMKAFKKKVSGEGVELMKVEGRGQLYLADEAKKISVLGLRGESVTANGEDVLAFEQTLEWDIHRVHGGGGLMAGGLFNVSFNGTGMLAVTTHGTPLTLRVTPDTPIVTDPQATVLWSGSLTPSFKTDVSFKTFLGRGSGESISMQFQGEGFVVIQPYEETPPTPQSS